MATRKQKPKTVRRRPARRFIVTRGRYLRMLAPFVSREETRYYIHGIHVERHPARGLLLVATDGHRMAIVHDAGGTMTGAPAVCPVSREALTAAARIDREARGSIYCRAVFRGDDLWLGEGVEGQKPPVPRTAVGARDGQQFVLPAIDGVFPPWRRVVPRKLAYRQLPVAINARYVADFLKVGVAAGLKGHEAEHFLFWQGPQPGPLVVRSRLIPEFVGLQMPVAGGRLDPLPDWLSGKEPS